MKRNEGDVMAAMKREDLCWSTGPRIGDEGHPYCLKPVGHAGNHESHPDSGYRETWGEPLCRANPDTIAAAWVPDDIDAATRRPETGPPETVSTGVVTPLTLKDLRRLVVDTAGWSPVTIVRVERSNPDAAPGRGETSLTVVRGSLAAHRKKVDIQEQERRNG